MSRGVKVIRIDREALLRGDASVQVTYPDGMRMHFHGVKIEGPSEVVASVDGQAWIETEAPLFPTGKADRRAARTIRRI